jgi:hypothetical protein
VFDCNLSNDGILISQKVISSVRDRFQYLGKDGRGTVHIGGE